MRTRLLLLALLVNGISPLAAQTSSASPRPSTGYQWRQPAPNADGVLRVLVYHDMEGLSGQDDWRTFDFNHPEQYRRGQELLVADLNAVIDGLFAGGADEVHVVDGHGSGNPEPDVPAGALHPRATQVLRDKWFSPYTGLVEPGTYDAVVVVGMHSKTGSGGFAAHTLTFGIELWLQDRSITETELIAVSWGREDVPVIFASGDDRLREDLRTMPWIEYVTVKEALSADSARLRPVVEARAELLESAKRAIENLPEMRAIGLEGPIRAGVRAVPPSSLAVLQWLPGIEYEDEKVTFTASDFESAWDGWGALTEIATVPWSYTFEAVAREHADGELLRKIHSDRLFQQWLDQESGRQSPPAPPATRTGRKYHGYR